MKFTKNVTIKVEDQFDTEFNFNELVKLCVLVDYEISNLKESMSFWDKAIKNPNEDETDDMKDDYKKRLRDSEENLKVYDALSKKIKRILLSYENDKYTLEK